MIQESAREIPNVFDGLVLEGIRCDFYWLHTQALLAVQWDYTRAPAPLSPDDLVDRGMGVGEHRTSYPPPEVIQKNSSN